MTNARALAIVDRERKYLLTPKNTMFYHVPEFCGQCGSPMIIKQGWKISGYDAKTGEPDKYKALVFCPKHHWWSWGYHDRRALIFTPAKFSIWQKQKKNGLSVLTLITKGI